MSEQEYQEQQEQMAAAAQLIINGAQEAQDYKAGGAKALQAAEKALQVAEAYKKLNDKTIETVSDSLRVQPVAKVSEQSLMTIETTAKSGASKGVKAALMETPAKVPSSEQLVPVFQNALNKVASEIKLQHPIKGKVWFWISLVLFALSGWHWFSTWHAANTFDGTAESWANRMYLANVELHEKNPGAGYDEIMVDFSSGRAEMAKEKVIRKENTASEINQHRKKYEAKISTLLEKYYPSGIEIIGYEETTGDRYEESLFSFNGNKKKNTYRFVFIKAVSLDEQKELRIVMEKPVAIFPLERWKVLVTSDPKINTVADYRQKSDKIKWEHSWTNAF